MAVFLRRLLLTLLFSLLVLVLALVIVTSQFKEQLGQRTLGLLQEQLHTELKVGSVDLALLETFPSAAIVLKAVVLKDRFGQDLLRAEKLALKFRPLSLFFSDKVKIHTLLVRNGELIMKTDRRGRANYDILKKRQTSHSSTTRLGLSIREAQLFNLTLEYGDARQGLEWSGLLADVLLAGDFSEREVLLTTVGRAFSRHLKVDTFTYLDHTRLGWDADLVLDLAKGHYRFHKMQLTLEESPFELSGQVTSGTRGITYDLRLASDEADLRSVSQLLPREWKNRLGYFESRGEMRLHATILGTMGGDRYPAIDVELSLDEGTIKSPKLGYPLKGVRMHATFTNGRSRSKASSRLEISSLSGYFDRQRFDMTFVLHDLDDPHIEFTLDGIVPVAAIYHLLDAQAIQRGRGHVEIRDLYVKGRYADMLRPERMSRVVVAGTLILDDAGLRINGESFAVDRGTLALQEDRLLIVDFKATGAGSRWTLEGQFDHLIPVLLSDASEQAPTLDFRVVLHAPRIDLDRIWRWFELPVSEGEIRQVIYDSLQEAHIRQRVHLARLLNGTFDMRIDVFNYREMQLDSFVGKLSIAEGTMRVSGQTRGMGGQWQFDGYARLGRRPSLQTRLQARRIDAKELFRQAENFGQSILRSEHLAGTLSAKVIVEAHWDEQGQFLYDQLKVSGGIGIREGRLHDFEMFEAFANYIRIDDLRRLAIADMEAWFDIRDETIFLPTTFVRSSVINLFITGEHTFQNEIQYYLKLNASQAALHQLRRRSGEPEPLPDKRKGWFNLHYHIFGTVDEFEYELDRPAVEAALKRGAHYRAAIQETLRHTFGDSRILY